MPAARCSPRPHAICCRWSACASIRCAWCSATALRPGSWSAAGSRVIAKVGGLVGGGFAELGSRSAAQPKPLRGHEATRPHASCSGRLLRRLAGTAGLLDPAAAGGVVPGPLQDGGEQPRPQRPRRGAPQGGGPLTRGGGPLRARCNHLRSRWEGRSAWHLRLQRPGERAALRRAAGACLAGGSRPRSGGAQGAPGGLAAARPSDGAPLPLPNGGVSPSSRAFWIVGRRPTCAALSWALRAGFAQISRGLAGRKISLAGRKISHPCAQIAGRESPPLPHVRI
jgi:hypothetical protein